MNAEIANALSALKSGYELSKIVIGRGGVMGWQRMFGGFMPLADAMKAIHLAAPDSPAARMALKGSDSNAITWYAYRSHSRGLPIYGKPRPSTRLELIPDDSWSNANLTDDGTGLIEPFQELPIFRDLSVKWWDLQRLWKTLIVE